MFIKPLMQWYRLTDLFSLTYIPAVVFLSHLWAIGNQNFLTWSDSPCFYSIFIVVLVCIVPRWYCRFCWYWSQVLPPSQCTSLLFHEVFLSSTHTLLHIRLYLWVHCGHQEYPWDPPGLGLVWERLQRSSVLWLFNLLDSLWKYPKLLQIYFFVSEREHWSKLFDLSLVVIFICAWFFVVLLLTFFLFFLFLLVFIVLTMCLIYFFQSW